MVSLLLAAIVASVSVEGLPPAAASGQDAPEIASGQQFERDRLAREAERLREACVRAGHYGAKVRHEVRRLPAAPGRSRRVGVVFRVAAGPVVERRVRFVGNQHLDEALLRKTLDMRTASSRS